MARAASLSFKSETDSAVKGGSLEGPGFHGAGVARVILDMLTWKCPLRH